MNGSAAPPRRGRFITFEGGEGAGKSTQARRLAAHLEQAGVRAVVTREPGGSPQAEAIRKFILSGRAAQLGPSGEAVLFSAARLDHVDRLIAPALASGTWVVCDRFADSTRAYQGAGSKAPASLIAALERIVVGPMRPDLTLLLDLPPEAGLARARSRSGADADRFEAETLDFHVALRRAFLDIARSDARRVKTVDASASEDEIADRVWEIVRETLPVGVSS